MNANHSIPRLLVALVACVTIAVGCSGAASAPTFAPSAGAEASTATVNSADGAVAAVLGANPRFGNLHPLDPNAIGQCCGYRVTSTADGWLVTVEVGWGDCPAGCIDRHSWVFSVDRSGGVVLQKESGPSVPAGLPGSGAGGTTAGSPPPEASAGTGGPTTTQGIIGRVTAGPTCPVVRPSDPACDERPIAGVAIHIKASDGTEVATLTADADGRFAVDLEPGAYVVAADPVPGMMNGPDPLPVTVPVGTATAQLTYDTGIR
jgi:hypothetical protein